jgi:hypothetical protein
MTKKLRFRKTIFFIFLIISWAALSVFGNKNKKSESTLYFESIFEHMDSKRKIHIKKMSNKDRRKMKAMIQYYDFLDSVISEDYFDIRKQQYAINCLFGYFPDEEVLKILKTSKKNVINDRRKNKKWNDLGSESNNQSLSLFSMGIPQFREDLREYCNDYYRYGSELKPIDMDDRSFFNGCTYDLSIIYMGSKEESIEQSSVSLRKYFLKLVEEMPVEKFQKIKNVEIFKSSDHDQMFKRFKWLMKGHKILYLDRNLMFGRIYSDLKKEESDQRSDVEFVDASIKSIAMADSFEKYEEDVIQSSIKIINDFFLIEDHLHQNVSSQCADWFASKKISTFNRVKCQSRCSVANYMGYGDCNEQCFSLCGCTIKQNKR